MLIILFSIKIGRLMRVMECLDVVYMIGRSSLFNHTHTHENVKAILRNLAINNLVFYISVLQVKVIHVNITNFQKCLIFFIIFT